jgi:hypothetical protein
MKIYIAHSSGYDFKNELYAPLENSALVKNHQIILPHKDVPVDNPMNTKEAVATMDLVIAEVSFPSTGQGIELGWADYFKTPIVCIYKKGSKFSSALKLLTKDFIEYNDAADMVNKLTTLIEKLSVT